MAPKRSEVPPVPDEPYVLAIKGSPRAGGNTDILVDAFCDGARAGGASVVVLTLREYDYQGCRSCGGCDTTGKCVWKDDCPKVIEHLRRASAVCYSTPVFFMGTESRTKAMIDRCQCVWSEHWRMASGKPAATRPGYFISTAATEFEWKFDAVKIVRDAFFLVLGIYADGEVLLGKLEDKGAVASDESSVAAARELGAQAAARITGETP